MKKLFMSKALYIVLLILSSLALIGAILVRIVIPAGNIGNMPNGQNFPGFQQGTGGENAFDPDNMPSFDADSMPSFDSEGGEGSFAPGEMPSMGEGEGAFTPGEMPSMGEGEGTFTPGEMPSMGEGEGSFTPGEMPSMGEGEGAFTPGEMPSMGEGEEGSFDPGQMRQDNMQVPDQKGGFLQSLRKAWLPIAIVSFSVMAFSIVMLAVLSRRKKKLIAETETEKYSGLSEDEILRLRVKEENEQAEKHKSRKKTKNIILSCILVITIVFVTIAGKMLTSGNPIRVNSQVDEEVLSESISSDTISTTLKGNGTVTFGEASSVALPGSVKIASWLVSNGTEVAAGDPIAEIDTDSAASAIADLQALIKELDSDLEIAREGVLSDELTANTAGRVIRIHAEEDRVVSELMGTYGALLILSLDGTLAVDLPQNNNVSVGSEVSFTLSDGTVITGKIASKNQTEMVAVVSDEETTVGDTVSVSDADGNELGSGTLYIHSEQKVTGFTGTVASVEVSEGELVEAGDVLLTLKDADYSMVAEKLLEKRSTLVEKMRLLLLAYASGYVYAGADGIVSGIDEDSAEAISFDTENASAAIGGSNAILKASLGTLKHVSLTVLNKFSLLSEEQAPSQEEPGSQTPGEKEPGNEEPGNEEPGNEEPGNEEPGNEEPGSEEPEEEDPEKKQAEELKATLIDKIDTLDYDALMQVFELLQRLENGEPGENEDPSKEPVEDPSKEEPVNDGPGTDQPTDDADPGKDIPGADDGNHENGGNGNQPGGFDVSDWNGTDLSGLSTETEEEEDEDEIDVSKYEISETAYCDITPDGEIYVDILIDEKDISLLSPGLNVTVSLDAYAGRSFAGTVSDIDKEGENNGGSTKYTVTVTATADVRALEGMNASVIIEKETKENVPVIPLKAVVEEGSRVFVYTGYDEENDVLLDPVEVELGISDGENAEIVSGLQTGDVYYYRYAGTIIYNFLNRLSK